MKRIFLFVFLNVWVGFLAAETDSTLVRLASFVKNVQVFNHLYPQEKVYLHFDNTGYFLGETIWFKAYVTLASDLRATPLNRVLYVELLDLEGNVTLTQKLRIENGQASGGLSLNKLGMKSGFYEVRAYTRSMLNWDTDYLFSRVFPVFDSPEKEGDYSQKKIRLRPPSQKIPVKRSQISAAKKVNLDLFAEGGHLVKGLTSTVAFKLTDKEGCSLEGEGCVCNEKGDTLSVFSTRHKGMGSFLYTPNGSRDKVWIQCSEEKRRYTFDLPQVDSTGCVMQVQNLHPDLLRIMISSSPSFDLFPLGVTVTCRGKVCYFQILDSSALSHSLEIPKSELSAGVNQVTLFTSKGDILAERLVYVPGASPLDITVHRDKESYRPFEPVKMDISVKDVSGAPVATSFSLAIRDKRTEIPSSYEETAYTNLLLSSDLKGYIENPGYYFESDDRTHRMNLDLLMLTQGYRRYPWSQMAGLIPFEAPYPIEKGILIDGAVKSIVRRKVKEDIDMKITLYSDSAYQQASCPTDTAGRFNYLASDFYGKWSLQLESKKKNKRKEYWITLDRQFSPQGRAYSFYDTYIPEMKANGNKTEFLLAEKQPDPVLPDGPLELDSLSSRIKLLKEVVVEGKRSWSELNGGINIAYDVEEEENRLEDDAKGYNEMLYEFLARINLYFTYELDIENEMRFTEGENYEPRGGFKYITRYKGKKASFGPAGEDISMTSPAITSSGEPGVTIIKAMENNGKNEQLDLERQVRNLESSIDYSTVYSSEVSLITISEHSLSTYIGVKLRPGNPAKSREPIGVRVTSIEGFSIPRAFYSPNYAEYKFPDEPDFRRTLYWNPNVQTNSQGKARVEFYNNISCREMSISAAAMTEDGNFGSYESEY